MELLLDAAWVGHDVSYTRIDSGGNTLAPWAALDGYPEDGPQRYAW